MEYRFYDENNDKYILPDGQVGYFNSNGYFVKCHKLNTQRSTNAFDCDGAEIYEGDSLYLADKCYGTIRYGSYYDFDRYDTIVGFYVEHDDDKESFDPSFASVCKVRHAAKSGVIEKPHLQGTENVDDIIDSIRDLVIQYIKANPETKEMYLRNSDGSLSAFTKIQMNDGTFVDLADFSGN